jgi:hypothetical protein
MKRILAVVLASVSPLIVLAQTYQTSSGIGGLFTLAQGFLNKAVPLLISLAVVYFIYQVFRYAVAGNEEDKAKAKTHMIWGIVGIFIMVSVWGLVAILQSTFGTTSGGVGNIGSQLPTLPQ